MVENYWWSSYDKLPFVTKEKAEVFVDPMKLLVGFYNIYIYIYIMDFANVCPKGTQ